MTGYEGIGVALGGLGESGDAPQLPQTGEGLLPSGEELVDIGLVPHVENKPVNAGIVYGLDGHRQLHDAQIGGQMSPGPGYAGDQKIPDLPAELSPLRVGEPHEVVVTMNAFQNSQRNTQPVCIVVPQPTLVGIKMYQR